MSLQTKITTITLAITIFLLAGMPNGKAAFSSVTSAGVPARGGHRAWEEATNKELNFEITGTNYIETMERKLLANYDKISSITINFGEYDPARPWLKIIAAKALKRLKEIQQNHPEIRCLGVKKLQLSPSFSPTHSQWESIFLLCPNLESISTWVYDKETRGFFNYMQALGRTFPKIRSLAFHGYEPSQQSCATWALKKLPGLNSLSYKDSSSSLQALFTVCPNVRNIDFSRFLPFDPPYGFVDDLLKILEDDPSFQAKNIKALTINYCTLRGYSAHKIFKIFPNLQYLSAYSCKLSPSTIIEASNGHDLLYLDIKNEYRNVYYTGLVNDLVAAFPNLVNYSDALVKTIGGKLSLHQTVWNQGECSKDAILQKLMYGHADEESDYV